MGPLTAFSLACGVIQVVEFGIEVVNKCRQLYKDGTLSQNTDAEEMAQQLTLLRGSLDLPNHRDQDELLKLGEKCSAIATDLIIELQKLNVSGPHRKRQMIGKTIKSIWKKAAIEAIQKRLDDCRKILDHRVLINLRNRFDLLSIQQNEGFQSLDLKVRMIITSLAQGPKTFKELKSLIHKEAQSVKTHVTNELQQHQRDLAHQEYCQRFLDSLWFPEIYRRQETIHEAHKKTFQWIYEPEKVGKTVRRWDNFSTWLKSGHCTYWINGKAGSGKSTLMNYIYQDERTAESLKTWSGSKEVFTPGFFFWNAGETLEQSSEGLLRSLIYQILRRFPSLTPSRQIESSSESMQNGPWSYETIAAWTERRLQATFRSVFRHVQEICCICIFIDGLDEFSGDQDMLIKLIESVQTADVKVCLSSRPYRSYSDAFGSSAKLQLQDLTKSDIRTYVSDKLHPLVNMESAKETYKTFDTIVDKAQGVFLWVELVVKDLIRGLKNDDTLEQLQVRLEFLPSDIEDLYAQMLSKIDTVYQMQAAKLFRMVLSDLCMGYRTGLLFTLALAFFRRSNKISDIGLSDVISYCEEAKQKIPTICMGLLEIDLWGREVSGGTFVNADPSCSLTVQYAKSSELAEVAFLRSQAHVRFIHRTARDYLEQSKQGNHFLEANTPPSFNAYILHVDALLTQATLLGFAAIHTDKYKYSRYGDHEQDCCASVMVYDIMKDLCLAEQQLESAQLSVCDNIDLTLAATNDRHGLPSPKVLREIMENTSVAERQNGTAHGSLCAEYDEVLAGMNRRSSSKAHWSVRWGMCSSNLVSSDCQVAPLSSTSRSSSTDSFHSVNSEPRLCKNFRVLPTRPVDFVGVAALWGLSRYVKEKLGWESKMVDQETADHLLCCSMWAFREMSSIIDGQLKRRLRSCTFAIEVLRLGGNCNIYVEDFANTLWGDFLTQTTWILSPKRSDIKETLAMTTKAFLDNGADVQVRVHREVAVRLSGLGSLEGQAVLEPNRYQQFTCIEENTALYAIQEVCGDMPEFGTLEKQIQNNGGSSSSRWTHITFNRSGPYEISEQQNHDLKAAFHGYGASDKEHDDSIQIRQKWALEIARLYKEIRGDNSDTDKLGSSNERVLRQHLWKEGSLVEAWSVLRHRH